MKTKQIINAVDENYYTIGANFTQSAALNEECFNGKTYTYKVHKSIELERGDRAIVLTNGQYKTVIVAEVHDEPNIDYDSDIQYQWIVQRIDRAFYDKLVLREERFAKTIIDSERKHKRIQVLEILGLDAKALLNALEEDKS